MNENFTINKVFAIIINLNFKLWQVQTNVNKQQAASDYILDNFFVNKF